MKALGAVLAAMLALAATSLGMAQSPTATLAVAPATSAATAGGSVAVDVTIANVAATPGLGGYAVKIAFNPAVVRMDSLTDAGLLANSIVFCLPATIDNTTGTATIGCSPLFSFGGYSTTAPVALLHATFTALAAGTSKVDLTGSTLVDPSNAPLAASLGSGTINVTAPSQQTTPTTTASNTPRASATVPSSPTTAATTTPPGTATPAVISTVPPSLVATIAASVLQAPDTGTGGGSGGFPWPIVAAAAAIALIAITGTALVLARRAGRA